MGMKRLEECSVLRPNVSMSQLSCRISSVAAEAAIALEITGLERQFREVQMRADAPASRIRSAFMTIARGMIVCPENLRSLAGHDITTGCGFATWARAAGSVGADD